MQTGGFCLIVIVGARAAKGGMQTGGFCLWIIIDDHESQVLVVSCMCCGRGRGRNANGGLLSWNYYEVCLGGRDPNQNPTEI